MNEAASRMLPSLDWVTGTTNNRKARELQALHLLKKGSISLFRMDRARDVLPRCNDSFAS